MKKRKSDGLTPSPKQALSTHLGCVRIELNLGLPQIIANIFGQTKAEKELGKKCKELA